MERDFRQAVFAVLGSAGLSSPVAQASVSQVSVEQCNTVTLAYTVHCGCTESGSKQHFFGFQSSVVCVNTVTIIYDTQNIALFFEKKKMPGNMNMRQENFVTDMLILRYVISCSKMYNTGCDDTQQCKTVHL